MTPQLNSRRIYSEGKGLSFGGGKGAVFVGFSVVVWVASPGGFLLRLFGLDFFFFKLLFCWFHFVAGLILGFFILMATYINIIND